ncbi:MAG: hypothetical protein ACREPV_07075 [Lysobacter sp.]
MTATPSCATLAALAATLAIALAMHPATAAEPKPYTVEQLQKIVADELPVTTVESVDHERITAHRIDLVDEAGVIRMTLAAPTPPPIIDGLSYQRAFPVAGMVVYDREGSERGGFGVADLANGGTAAVLALDHANVDAVGWRVMPDGAVEFGLNAKPPQPREPTLDNRVVPHPAVRRIAMNLAADGTPSLNLADTEGRPRLRLTVTEEGYGAIEFLDAEGKVVQTLAPEAAGG